MPTVADVIKRKQSYEGMELLKRNSQFMKIFETREDLKVQ